MLRPRQFNADDFGGNQAKADEANTIYGAGWDKANPAGTLIADQVNPYANGNNPILAFKDSGDARTAANVWNGLVADAEKSGRTTEQEVAAGIANGTLTNKDAANNYGALAAQKLGEASNMGSFSYDFNSDPIFKILSNSYMQQARDAASNASALAAARTGGYGNSYGAAAAAQQYNRALGDLYDQVPELQQAAYARWQNDRNALLDQADRYQSLSDAYYGKDWNETGRAHDWENDAWEKDYQSAVTAAQMGEYGPLEKLLGVDMSAARGTDQLNKILSIIQLYGDSAPSILQQLQRVEPDIDRTTQLFVANGASWYLPADKEENGIKYEYTVENGRPYVTTTDKNGNKKKNPYTGIAVSQDGTRQINLSTGETGSYSGPTKTSGFSTGDATVDDLLGRIAQIFTPVQNSTTAPVSIRYGSGGGGIIYDYGGTGYDPVADAAVAAADKQNTGGGKSYSDSGSGSGTGGETTAVVPQATVPGGDAPKEINVSTEEFDDILKRSTR